LKEEILVLVTNDNPSVECAEGGKRLAGRASGEHV
jgi:hypothetical protein